MGAPLALGAALPAANGGLQSIRRDQLARALKASLQYRWNSAALLADADLDPPVCLYQWHHLIQFRDDRGFGRLFALPRDFAVNPPLLCGFPLEPQVFGLIARVGQVQAPCARFCLSRHSRGLSSIRARL